jgi:hypothetical protein
MAVKATVNPEKRNNIDQKKDLNNSIKSVKRQDLIRTEKSQVATSLCGGANTCGGAVAVAAATNQNIQLSTISPTT